MKQITLTLLLGLLLFGCDQGNTPGEAQNQTKVSKDNIKHKTIPTVIHSWPKNDTVLQIKKGSNGTILIVSKTGVFQYDGKAFTNLASEVDAHQFNDALYDRKGGLWFASLDSGVYYKKGTSFQQFTSRDGLANDQVICIYEDKAGIIWFGTGGGLSRYDGKSFQNFTMKGEHWWDNFITTIMQDNTGKLWIGTRGYACIYDGKTFTTFSKKDNVFDVWSIIEDKNSNIWFGGYDGLRRYDGKTFTKIAGNTGYNFIIGDKNGNMWSIGIVNSSWALSRYDEKSLNDLNPTITEIMSGRAGTPSGILEANDGSIWFGNNGGLYRYDGKTITDFKNKDENN